MKKDRTKLIITALAAFALFSSFIALWIYAKNKEIKSHQKQMVHLFVLNKNVPKNYQITPKDIVLKEFPKDVVTWKIPSEHEILHRYTTAPMYRGEPLLKQKLSVTPIAIRPSLKTAPQTQNGELQTQKSPKTKHDIITLPLWLFQNIDTTLKKGDRIDIVSIEPKTAKTSRMKNFSTKYVAVNVKINSFTYGTKRFKTIVVNATQDMKQQPLLAQTINLEVTPKNVKNLFAVLYKAQELNMQRTYNRDQQNKGHLWLVKCAKKTDPQTLREKEKLLADYKPPRRTYKRRTPRKKKEEPLRIDYED